MNFQPYSKTIQYMNKEYALRRQVYDCIKEELKRDSREQSFDLTLDYIINTYSDEHKYVLVWNISPDDRNLTSPIKIESKNIDTLMSIKNCSYVGDLKSRMYGIYLDNLTSKLILTDLLYYFKPSESTLDDVNKNLLKFNVEYEEVNSLQCSMMTNKDNIQIFKY